MHLWTNTQRSCMYPYIRSSDIQTYPKNQGGAFQKNTSGTSIKTNEMYLGSRYVKCCCWQFLMLPRWLVPNDRPAKKVFDNTSTTIQHIPFSLFIFLFLRCCLHLPRVEASWDRSLHLKFTLFCSVGYGLLSLKITLSTFGKPKWHTLRDMFFFSIAYSLYLW